MINFDGRIFNDEKELNDYVKSKAVVVDNPIEKLAKALGCKIEKLQWNNNTYNEITDYQVTLNFNNTKINISFSADNELEDVQNTVQRMISIINKIEIEVKKIGIEYIHCTECDEEQYEFQFMLHNGEKKIVKTKSYNVSYKDIKEFINSFKQYTTNILKGHPTQDSEWNTIFQIGGIEIQGIMEKAINSGKEVELRIVD